MKASLRYLLPEERVEFNDAYHGSDWKAVVEEMHQAMRNHRKYAQKITIDQLWDRMFLEINERGLSLDE